MKERSNTLHCAYTTRVRKFVFFIAVTLFVTLACSSVIQMSPMPSEVPTMTRITITSAMTDTPTPRSTSTPFPTRTATPIPVWIANFAEPVLAAIKDQPPHFQDDFSNPASQWSIGRIEESFGTQTPDNPGIHIFGNVGYIEGEYFTTAAPVSCVGGFNERIGVYKDFVVEFDARFSSGVHGDYQIQFHRNDMGLYSVNMNRTGAVWIAKRDNSCNSCGFLSEYNKSYFKGTQWNHFALIVRLPQIALYVNDIPVAYMEDKHVTQPFETGTFSLTVCNTGSVSMETRWDNLKIWDISSLP